MHRTIGLAFGFLGLLAGTAQANGITLTPSAVTAPTGEEVAYDAGILTVPENRAAPKSALIRIGFARVRATTPRPGPAIVFLSGGPGTSYLDAFTATTPTARSRLRLFRNLATAGDVVVLEQRGFSKHGTMLVLPPVPPEPLDRPGSVAATAAQWTALARAAVAANPARSRRLPASSSTPPTSTSWRAPSAIPRSAWWAAASARSGPSR